MLYFQSFDEVFSAFKRRFGLIVLITFIGCVFSVYAALNQTPTYNAIAVVQIEDAQVSGAMTGDDGDRSSLDGRRTVRLIEQRVMARDVLLEIIEEYELFATIRQHVDQPHGPAGTSRMTEHANTG